MADEPRIISRRDILRSVGIAGAAAVTSPATLISTPGPAAAIETRRRYGASRIPKGSTMGASTHAYGGTRMGDNPETNVLNRWGMSHEVPNLGVLGGSVMGTSGARNPTLHRAGSGLAHRGAHRQELEGDHVTVTTRSERRAA